MALDTDISLTTVEEVLAFLGEDAKKDGIWVYWSSDDADAATVEVTDTTFVLKVTVGTAHRAVTSNVATIGTDAAHGLVVGSSVVISDMGDATYDGTHTVTVVDDTTHFKFTLTHADEVETADTAGTVIGTNTLTFADADKDIISELITAINALTGWKSGRICHGDAASTDLVVTGALDADGTENEQVLKIVDNYLLTELINRASDLINRYCNRILVSSTYAREIYYGAGFNKLLLEQYPVTQVNRLSVGRANCFSVQNTNTSATFATVEVTPDAIILTEDGTETSYTLATYATITLLLAAIAGGNWSCTLVDSSFGDIDLCYTTDNISNILVRPAMDCLTPGMVYVEIVDDDIADYKLLKPTEARNEGILYKPGVFGSGTEYFIDYQAGYTDPIPYALEQACIELVAYKYGKSKRADSGDLQSETFGEGADYKYVKFNLADIKNILPPELLAQLDLFKKRSF